MNTRGMNTRHLYLPQLGYAGVDAHVRALDLSPFGDRHSVIAAGEPGLLANGEPDLLPRLQSVYRAVRPILSILAELPLLPPHWRDALRLFIATVDAIAAAGEVSVEDPVPGRPVPGGTAPKPPNPEFKAGKDL
jgi:hypothetical protein